MNTHTCGICKHEKPVSEFGRRAQRGGKPAGYCRACYSAKSKRLGQETKTFMLEYLGGKCSVCGYAKCPTALEFHHLDATKKEFELSRMGTYSRARIIAELNKCVLLCANCHREVHYVDPVGIAPTTRSLQKSIAPKVHVSPKDGGSGRI